MWYNVWTVRTTLFAPGEHYHILNRGNNKQLIFHDDRDRARFLFSLLYFQGSDTFANINRIVSRFARQQTFTVPQATKEGQVKLVNFCLMSNHFHATVEETSEGGTSAYMQRVLNSYTKYFNTKYDQSGHLFQGPFKAVPVMDNEQLLYLSAYIHRNPREIREWYKRESEYPWSSYQDYTTKNRWGNLLHNEIILSQFKSPDVYAKFLEESVAKERDLIEEHTDL